MKSFFHGIVLPLGWEARNKKHALNLADQFYRQAWYAFFRAFLDKNCSNDLKYECSLFKFTVDDIPQEWILAWKHNRLPFCHGQRIRFENSTPGMRFQLLLRQVATEMADAR